MTAVAPQGVEPGLEKSELIWHIGTETVFSNIHCRTSPEGSSTGLFMQYLLYILLFIRLHFAFNFVYRVVLNVRIAKERVHLAYKHPELLLDLMKKGIISTSLACNDLEVTISITIVFTKKCLG